VLLLAETPAYGMDERKAGVRLRLTYELRLRRLRGSGETGADTWVLSSNGDCSVMAEPVIGEDAPVRNSREVIGQRSMDEVPPAPGWGISSATGAVCPEESR
jgi:hypothetical protein